MKVVVAGGTGFLGRHISKGLMGDGHLVTVLGRNPAKVASIPQLIGANSAKADVTDPASLHGTLDGADAVVVAVQFPNYPMEQRRRGLTFDLYDRQGTENLIAEAKRAGVGRFFYMSGAGVHPRSTKSWYRAKGLAEEAIKNSGLRYAILRPSWAYGPEDKALNKFVKIARVSPVVPKPAPIDGPRRFGFLKVAQQLIQPISYEDVALAARRIFERDVAWDRTLEIGSRVVMTMDQVIKTMLRVLRMKRVVVPVPSPLLKMATAPLGLLPKPPLTPRGVDFAIQDGLVDPTEAMKILDIDPMPFEEGLARYLSPARARKD